MLVDAEATLRQLAVKRPIFHSEADFQHALAWTLHERHPEASIRLEYLHDAASRQYTDIWLSDHGRSVAIELKYLTRSCSTIDRGERFTLSNHAANDIRRYDVVKDLMRLEQVAETTPATSTVLIALTNDPAYWLPPRSSLTVDDAFRIHDERVIEGTMAWGAHAGPGTMRGREDPLTLRYSYRLKWRDYSDLGGLAGRFRYLLIERKGQQ